MLRPTLNRIWASGDDSQIKDPGDAKYQFGWEAEIPTYQILNFLQNKADTTLLALGERGVFEWGSDILYKAGSLAWDDLVGKIYVSMVDAPNPTLPPSQSLSQWELSSVQLTRTEFDALNADITNHVGQLGTTNPHQLQPHDVDTYSREEIDAMLGEDSDANAAHIADVNNPHATTAAQAGGVNTTGGEYTGPVTMGSGVTNLNTDGTATLDTTGGLLGILVGDSGLGVNGAGTAGIVTAGGFEALDDRFTNKNGDTMFGTLNIRNGVLGLVDAAGADRAHLGIGTADVFLTNILNGSSLKLNDDGTLTYANFGVYHEGNPPPVEAVDVGVETINGEAPDDAGNIVINNIDVGAAATVHTHVPADIVGLMDLMMPVGTLHPSTNPANPATYFGFGTWEARAGLLAGVGTCTDSAGMTGSYIAGYNGGFWRVQNSHFVGATFNLANGYANGNGDHAHHFEVNTQGGGNHQHDYYRFQRSDGGADDIRISEDDIHYGNFISYTGWAGDHIHFVGGDTWGAGLHDHSVTGSVTIGDGDVLTGGSFFNPYFGAYIWERTA